MNHNLFSLFYPHFERQPDKVLMDTDDGRQYRYRDVLSTSRRLASRLRAWGLQPGDRIAVQIDKSPEMLMLYLAS
ncbi:AMP-binding protein, partial [Bacillus cereus group sp. Bce001]